MTDFERDMGLAALRFWTQEYERREEHAQDAAQERADWAAHLHDQGGVTYRALADYLGISRSRAQQLVERGRRDRG